MRERRRPGLCGGGNRPPMGRGFAARAHLACGPWAGPVRAAIPCNELRTRTVMANNPKRVQDPTEAAMSAIQEALNLREDPPATPARNRTCASDRSDGRSVRQYRQPKLRQSARAAAAHRAAPPRSTKTCFSRIRSASRPRASRSAARRPLPPPSRRSSRSSAPPMTTASRSARSCSRCSADPRARPTWRRSSSRSPGWCSG